MSENKDTSLWLDIYSVLCVVFSFYLAYVFRSGHFYALSLIAVVIQGWSHGLKRGLLVALLLPLITTLINLYSYKPLNVVIKDNMMFAFISVLLGFSLGKVSDTNRKLKSAREEIYTLKSLIPICASCKKIRNEEEWEELEAFLEKHQDMTFSHGVCPECAKELYEEMGQYRDKQFEKLDVTQD